MTLAMPGSVAPDWSVGLHFWWAIIWRFYASVFVAGAVFSLLIDGMARATGMVYLPFWFRPVAVGVPILFVYMYLLIRVLERGFGRYRLVVTERA